MLLCQWLTPVPLLPGGTGVAPTWPIFVGSSWLWLGLSGHRLSPDEIEGSRPV